jgi:MFS family permease
MRGTVDHRVTGLLGVVTICAYGSWYYAFGVLLDPIRLDTGWRESTLTASFSIGIIGIGLGSLAGGRLLDRVGPRRVFIGAAVLGGAALFGASFAPNVWVFLVASAAGLGVFGSLGFYHVTMATAVRLNPDNPARAIAVLTIWGALASAIYLPLTAALVDDFGWRVTVRILAASSAAAFVLAAALLPSMPAGPLTVRPPLRSIVSSAVAPGGPRYFALAVGCGGIAMSTLLVYQVPTMTALGLPAATAATFAGVRGFAQLGGRLPLGRLLDRFGVDRSLILAFSAIAVGGCLLAFADNRPTALVFAIVAGFGIGAFSPLQGIKAQELFETETLGATMGFYGSLMMLAGSVGPATAGVIADATGERRWASGMVALAALGAAAAVVGVARETAAERGPTPPGAGV